MELYVFRHGETDWNKIKRLQGSTDIDLNENGIELAKVTANAVKDIHFDYAFSSPLIRACHTGSIILGDRDIKLNTDDRLKEMNFGEDEGKMPEERSEGFSRFFEKPGEYIPSPGGETIEELCERTKNFVEEVLIPLSIKEPDCRVVVFGHGAMNKSIHLYLTGKSKKDLWAGQFPKNCCVNIYTINGYKFELLEEAKIYYNLQ